MQDGFFDRGIDVFQICYKRFDIPIGHKLHGIADLVDNITAGFRRLDIWLLWRLSKMVRAVHTGN